MGKLRLPDKESFAGIRAEAGWTLADLISGDTMRRPDEAIVPIIIDDDDKEMLSRFEAAMRRCR